MKCNLGLCLSVVALAFVAACDETRVRVDRVEPAEGITGGGDQVNIIAAGLQPGKTAVRVTFGHHVAEQVVIASAGTINVVTPSADKGPVDVTVDFDDGQRFVIPAGFRYVEPRETDDLRKSFFNRPRGARQK
jgi:hypothetical protein